jgi:hypothetical protein
MPKAIQPTRTLVCPVCGEKFTTRKRNKKFCSPACTVINNHAETAAKRESARVHTRECPGCGSSFEPVGRQRYCSRQCQSRLWQRTHLGIADPGLIGKCWWCHDEFSLLDGRKFYCSPECAKFVKSLWNLSRYGITRDDYRDAWYRQGGLCAICRQPERTTRNHLLSVDHDHVSGQFRGLLCSHCNRAVGLLGDDPKIIEAAAGYVRQSRQLKPVGGNHG